MNLHEKKIGIVVQRYGIEVNGGAEYHARVLAEQLNKKHSVEIITTTALNHHDWESEYPIGNTIINNIPVKRFFSKTKNHKKFRIARRIILERTKLQRFLKRLKIYDFVRKHTDIFSINEKDSKKFLKEQGPFCPDLIEYIRTNKNNYDCFIFFTYLYYPTAIGMELVAEKSIFIPTAHDEPIFYSAPYKNLFSIPKYIIYNTSSEKLLVEKNFPNATKQCNIAGIGIDSYTNEFIDEKFEYNFEYLLYIGRIEGSKGCEELAEYFKKLNLSTNLKLVFVGKNNSNLTPSDEIIFTGFVSEQQKYQLLKNCKSLIIPSKFESLSLVTLEAMMHKKIVIANKECDVLKKHIEDSSAGFSYSDFESFQKTINSLLTLTTNEKEIMVENGYRYVTENYTWKKILQKFDKAIKQIEDSNN